MSALFDPITIGGITLANRIVVSPMCQYSAIDGIAQDWHLVHIGNLMISGASLVIMEATAVEAIGRITHGCLGLYDDDQERSLAALVGKVKKLSGAAIGIQLSHAGRKGSNRSIADRWKGEVLPPEEGAWQTVGPSAVAFDQGWPIPSEMTEEDIAALTAKFASAAARADRAGFDALEIHAAHGYLLHTFLSPISNHRTDGYGGTRDGRFRFPLEVARAVRQVWPTRKMLGFRINSTDWIPGGSTLDDAVAFAHALKAEGVDYAVMSAGNLAAGAKIPPATPGHQVEFATRVKREAGMNAMAVGFIIEPALAQSIVAEERADAVALGRAMLDNPRWGIHAAAALGIDVPYPTQYLRARPNNWPGFRVAHPQTGDIATTQQMDRPPSHLWDRPK